MTYLGFLAIEVQNLSKMKYQTPLIKGSMIASMAANPQLAPVMMVLQVIAMKM